MKCGICDFIGQMSLPKRSPGNYRPAAFPRGQQRAASDSRARFREFGRWVASTENFPKSMAQATKNEAPQKAAKPKIYEAPIRENPGGVGKLECVS